MVMVRLMDSSLVSFSSSSKSCALQTGRSGASITSWGSLSKKILESELVGFFAGVRLGGAPP